MKHLVFLVCLSSGLFAITCCQANQDPGNVVLSSCRDDLLDIRENQNNTIRCEGFNPQATIVWSIRRKNQDRMPVATCDPSNCTVHQSDHFAVQRSPSHSLLFYQQYNSDLDGAAVIVCESQLADEKRGKTCKLNVINPANLSNCRLVFDEKNGNATGRCRFFKAYSFQRPFSCVWLLRKNMEVASQFRGTISQRNLHGNFENGLCTFTWTTLPLDPSVYTYSIDFYPGPGEIIVHNGTTGNRHSISKQGRGGDDNELPIAAIAGGVAGAVAVIIIVVVVLVVIRRKRRQNSDARAHWSKPDASKEDNEFEEHVNPMYITSEDQDDSQHSGHKPSAVALQISSDTRQEQSTGRLSRGTDLYTSVDGEDTHNQYSAADSVGGYEDIGYGGNQNAHTLETDDGYSVVDEPRSKQNFHRRSSAVQSTHNNHEYAVVDKRGARNTGREHASSPPNTSTASGNGGTDEFAQVNKAAKRKVVSQPEEQGEAYPQVQKPKPAAKPKISAKSSLQKDADYSSAANDEYRTLNHSRGGNPTQSQGDVDSHYSHIGNV